MLVYFKHYIYIPVHTSDHHVQYISHFPSTILNNIHLCVSLVICCYFDIFSFTPLSIIDIKPHYENNEILLANNYTPYIHLLG